MPNEKQMQYSVLPPRMPPLAQDRMTAAQKQAVADMLAGPRGKVDGPYWAIMRSPGLTAAMQKTGEYFRFECQLDKRLTELAILLTARAWTQQYVWDFHAPVAVKAGLKTAGVEAIAEARRPLDLADDEAVVYDFVTELLANKSVSDATYARALPLLGETGVMDVLGVVGYYSMLATVLNVARVPLENDRPLPLTPMPAQLRHGS
jgi:4-carboxymuconolactone decarboxylase